LREKDLLILSTHVKADETYIGGNEINKHENKKIHSSSNSEKKVPVIGIVEKGGKVVTKASPWVTKKVVSDMIRDHVPVPAILVTDGAPIYNKIGKRYDHVVVNHAAHQYVNNGFHTNGMENYWSLVKRGIVGIYHQVSPKHLQSYLDEFSYRFNSRKIKDNDRFELTLSHLEGSMPYKKLIAKKYNLYGEGKEIEQTPEE
jgi:transposase-like protein